MTSKYDKHFITDCTKPRPATWGPVGSGLFDMDKIQNTFPEANLKGSGVYYTRPHVMVKDIHIHDFDEYLFFLGTNVTDLEDFDAEIEIFMGEEAERHLITRPTILYVPAKMKHCPLNFAKINKPMLFFHVRVPVAEK
jgi:hypothetical protein